MSGRVRTVECECYHEKQLIKRTKLGRYEKAKVFTPKKKRGKVSTTEKYSKFPPAKQGADKERDREG